MKIYQEPARADWPALTRRPAKDFASLRATVSEIMETVMQGGDAAVAGYTRRFDKVDAPSFRVSAETLAAAEARIDPELAKAIRTAHANIEKFHATQALPSEEIETMPGVRCWRESRAIERVGLYVPGGTAPLFSTVLMLAVPARLAGCGRIVLCSPPGYEGGIHPATLFAAHLCGVTEVFAVGGAQAIAAMTYGTETVPAVYKLFGPGNAYVTAAKQLASLQGVAIDMPAGPSEVLVAGDAGAGVRILAMDLLSQAEHGADSQVVFVTDTNAMAESVSRAVADLVRELPRRTFAERSMANSFAVVLADRQDRLDFINRYAPEHLILSLADARAFAAGIRNAGSI